MNTVQIVSIVCYFMSFVTTFYIVYLQGKRIRDLENALFNVHGYMETQSSINILTAQWILQQKRTNDSFRELVKNIAENN